MRSQFWATIATSLPWPLALPKASIVKKHTTFGIVGSIVLITSVVSKAPAQLPPISNLQMPSPSSSKDSDSQVVAAWIRLDGHGLFKIAAPRADLPERVGDIEQRLRDISHQYSQSASESLQIQVKTENNLPVLYVNNRYLLTVTDLDAKLQEQDQFELAQILSNSLGEDLRRAKQERQPQFLAHQGKIAGGIFLGVVISSWGVRRWHYRSKLQPIPTTPTTHPVTTQLSQQQKNNMQEVRQRLSQLVQSIIWSSGTLIVLNLFPHTRMIQVWVLAVLEVPFILGVVALGTYLVIRLSYVLIDKSTCALASNALLTPEDPLRLQLRLSTISSVTKSISTFSAVLIGTFVALTAIGINIAPLLAGAGLIGVAVSLASQNIIKDAINGFLIILEDQYALGDIITVGNMTGLVENLNLRITQLRDSEGRLITIPNSEVKIVANLSSRWSRADLRIPVAYQANIDKALKLIETVGFEMDSDSQWQEQILEPPQVLGVEEFGDRGLMIRVWIKTQPLKQWDVAREYRRRLKIAFDNAGIAIPFPQQSVWLSDSQLLEVHSDGSPK